MFQIIVNYKKLNLVEENQNMDQIYGNQLDSAQKYLLVINTIRVRAVDAEGKAKSGRPALPMGAPSMAFVPWTRFLRHNPSNPHGFAAWVA